MSISGKIGMIYTFHTYRNILNIYFPYLQKYIQYLYYHNRYYYYNTEIPINYIYIINTTLPTFIYNTTNIYLGIIYGNTMPTSVISH